MTNALTKAEFFGTPVTILDHAGKHWLTAEEAGLCLGYNPANARQGTLKIFERHQDEFTDADTFVVKLTTNPLGGNPNSRIFSDTGCIKLGFFTNTPRAKDFRTWAAKVLAGQSPAAVPPAPTSPDARLDRLDANMAQLAAGMSTVLIQLDVTRKYIGLLELNQTGTRKITAAVVQEVHALKGEGMNNADIGRLLRISRTAVSLIVHEKYRHAPALPEPQASVSELLEGWIEREQGRLATALSPVES